MIILIIILIIWGIMSVCFLIDYLSYLVVAENYPDLEFMKNSLFLIPWTITTIIAGVALLISYLP